MDFPEGAVPKVTNGTIVRADLDMQNNTLNVVARYTSQGQQQQISASVAAASIINTCDDPLVVQAALVEFKLKAVALAKAALKAKIEE